MKRANPGSLAFFLVVIFFLVTPVLAQQPTPSDDQVNALAREIYCPVCENTPLDVCPTKACAQWRELIREKLALGWTEQQIKDYFAAQYGDRVLAEPPIIGSNPLLYLLPPVFLMIVAFFVYRRLSPVRRELPDKSEIQSKPVVSDDYVNRVDEELEQYKRN
jgi:cytochrome c-type biogenesis protein CcmH